MCKIIACDLGTSSIKAYLFDESGNIYGSFSEGYNTYYENAVMHEQKPLDWWEGIIKSIKELIKNSGASKNDIECLAISGHSLGVVPVDKKGELLRKKTPIWSDSRAKKQASDFFKYYDYKKWYQTTGNGFPAELYTVFKILWFKENEPEIYKKATKFLGTKDYINYKLTGKILTDYSYASGSGVYNLKNWSYDDELINSIKLDKNKLPEIVTSTHIVGGITKEVANKIGLTPGIPVVCGGVDNSCMALGAKCYKKGRVYTSLGSSAWIAVSSLEPILDIKNKPFVFTHVVSEQFVSAVPIFSAGNSFKWVRDIIFSHSKEPIKSKFTNTYELMSSLAEASPIGAKKLLFNPSLAGGSSLDKSVNIKGGYVGLTLGHTINDIIRAAMEGIALNLRVTLDELEKLINLSKDMILVGGGSKSTLWRRIFADVYNKNIIKTNINQEATSLGVAAVAAVGTGIWNNFEKIDSIIKLEEKIRPIEENVKKYEKILPVFKNVANMLSDIGNKLSSLKL